MDAALNFGATDSLTLEVRIQTSAEKANVSSVILSKRVVGLSQTYYIDIPGGAMPNMPSFFFGRITRKLFAPTKVNDSYWHHIACVRNKETNRLLLYVDGYLLDKVDKDISEDLTNTKSLFIGTHLFSMSDVFDGEIDEV
ncbi:uncharacterized protein METZ01_LOCUS267894 [marine metagenome]|uniref:Laminin G domain-containing protein n=1 Tax=marine metagenome TaxID=408172 RepID=A0A382JSG5_9ZZZZ